MTFTVALSQPVQSGVLLTADSSLGTALAADFTAVNALAVQFAPNSTSSQTIDVAISNDGLDEDDESFTLTLSGLTAVGAVSLGTANASGTIEDDDQPPVISVNNPSQPEGDGGNTSMQFQVSLSQASGRAVTFTRGTADGTATSADNDYVPLEAASATIPAGATALIIPVQVRGDTTFEGPENFHLMLTDVVHATGTSLSGTATIEEDDAQPTSTTISATNPDPSVVGQPYAVIVTVSGQTQSPQGTVIVSDGTVSCGPVALASGAAPQSTATCNLSSSSAGSKTLVASYVPADSAFAGSSSAGTAHQVNAAATSIQISGPARSRINQPSSFSVALTVDAPGAGNPAGILTLSSGASTCNVTVPTLTPSCALSFSSLGTRNIRATFTPSDGNFLASSTGAAGDAQTLVYALSDLAVTKSNGVGTYAPGAVLVYSISLTHAGPDAAAQIRLRDTVPAGLLGVDWTCTANGGAACPMATGSGDLDLFFASFPVGGRLDVSLFGTVNGSPAQLSNTAWVELPADHTIEDPVPANNSATDMDVLDPLFHDGFEEAMVHASKGLLRLPTTALRGALDHVARELIALNDAHGPGPRVYARRIGDVVQYALATPFSGRHGTTLLSAWRTWPGEPGLRWAAHRDAEGWVLDTVHLH